MNDSNDIAAASADLSSEDGDATPSNCSTGISRRCLLGAASALGLAGFAGCAGLSSGGSAGSDRTPITTVEGPATFTGGQIDGPSEATVDDDISLTIDLVNIGSENGDFEGKLTVAKGNSELSKEIETDEVAPKERSRTELEVSFANSDEFELTVTGDDLEDPPTHTIDVGPVQASVGDALDLADALTVTVTDVQYEQSLFYEKTEQGYWDEKTTTQLADSGSQNVFAVVTLDLENISTETIELSPRIFEPTTGAIVETLGQETSFSAVKGIETPPMQGTLNPGQSLSAMLLASVPAESVRSEGLELGYQRDSRSTPPEKVWTADSSSLPQFELVEWDVPETIETGYFSLEYTVKNVGDAPGTFRGAIASKKTTEDRSAYDTYAPKSADLAPGESKTFEISNWWPYLVDLDYRLRPFDTTATSTFAPTKLPLGESFPWPNASLVIDRVETTQRIAEDEENLSPESVEAGAGKHFLCFHARMSNKQDPGACKPDESKWSVISESGEEYHTVVETFTYDVASPSFFDAFWDGYSCGINGSTSGWLAFEVPTSVTPDTAAVKIAGQKGWVGSVDHTISAMWSNRF